MKVVPIREIQDFTIDNGDVYTRIRMVSERLVCRHITPSSDKCSLTVFANLHCRQAIAIEREYPPLIAVCFGKTGLPHVSW